LANPGSSVFATIYYLCDKWIVKEEEKKNGRSRIEASSGQIAGGGGQSIL
jgi:hypothetical protein